jgi:DNA processing protein
LGAAPDLSEHEFKALAAISTEPRHADAIAASAGMSPQATTAALLTLALENVVVEGPPGFFRRQEAHNR